MFTSHNLGMLKLKKKIDEIPVEKLNDQQKRFLANAAINEKGMITIHDVQMEKREQAAKVESAMKDAEVQKRVKALLETQAAAKKKPTAPKVKADGKKKAE